MLDDYFNPDASSARLRGFASIFSVAAMLGGMLFILFYGVPILKAALESWNWIPVQGTVTQSHARGTGGGSYRPFVVFQYDVSGKTYESRTIWMGDEVGLPGRQRVEGIIQRYPKGERITAYYDPTNPDRAVLERGVHGTTLFHFYFGGVFLTVGLIVWLLRPAMVRLFTHSSGSDCKLSTP